MDKKIFNSIKKDFGISIGDMRHIIKDFHSEMIKGLNGEKSSLKMIPTYVDRPTGNEKGSFIALDLGGTNFRVLGLELKGNGKMSTPRVKKYALHVKHMRGTKDELFDFISEAVKDFLISEKIKIEDTAALGFTFSFPVEQTGIASGRLLKWTKGFSAKGVVGEDVVELFNDALRKNGIGNVTVTALANDTVGTLATRSYEDPDCDVGIIIGTGTNACYPERMSNIRKWKDPQPKSNEMMINIEWGNFNKLHLTIYDKRLDGVSSNKGQQILEKMVSGMYLGEVARLVFDDLIKKRVLFNGVKVSPFRIKYGFKSEYMSIISGDRTRGLSKTARLLEGIGISGSTAEDRKLVRTVCDIVSTRAARISASAMAAVITKMDKDLSRRHTVALDGSVYEKHPGFARNMRIALDELFAGKSKRIRMVLAKDGSGKGAAVIAAVAASS
ncbi:MAG: hypothetical protein PHP46_02045 [Candidatus Omnitrophica bacterium]|nr:hypothetical protein [Candidatus Omnitrophota bacterium]